MTCIVYGLYSPKDGLIRYVGQTTIPLRRRVKQHLQTAREGGDWPVAKWIRKLIREGRDLQAVVIVEYAEWNTSEIATIARYRAEGFALLNATDGGEGVTGSKHTPEQRARWSEQRRGKAPTVASIEGTKQLWQQPGFREKRSALVRERYANAEVLKQHGATIKAAMQKPEVLANMKARTAKRLADPEINQKIAAAHRELWKNPAHREKMRIARSKKKEAPCQ